MHQIFFKLLCLTFMCLTYNFNLTFFFSPITSRKRKSYKMYSSVHIIPAKGGRAALSAPVLATQNHLQSPKDIPRHLPTAALWISLTLSNVPISRLSSHLLQGAVPNLVWAGCPFSVFSPWAEQPNHAVLLVTHLSPTRHPEHLCGWKIGDFEGMEEWNLGSGTGQT